EYTLEGRAGAIACPSLICSAEGDEIGATAKQLFDAVAGPKRFQRFTVAEAAGTHCECGARLLFNQRAFDWLDEMLKPTTPAARPGGVATERAGSSKPLARPQPPQSSPPLDRPRQKKDQPGRATANKRPNRANLESEDRGGGREREREVGGIDARQHRRVKRE